MTCSGRKETRYQIKSCRLHPLNPSRQLEVIHNLTRKDFDFLIAVLFNKNYAIHETYKIPHGLIGKYAHYSKRKNGHMLQLNGELLSAKGVESIMVA